MQVSEANQEYNEEIIAEREAILQRKKDKILQRFIFVSHCLELLCRLQTI